jgi:spoIIIJ-associated protein
MAEIEVEGKTVEDAIKDGLAKLGCSRDKVEIKILNEGTTGLFGLMGTKPARVLLITKSDDAEASVAGNVDFTAAQAQVKESLSSIFKLMHIEFSEIHTSLMAGRVLVDIKSPEGSLIIGKGGQNLEAMEHIINLIINKNEDTRVKVNLDIEEYRHRQEDRLQVLARKAADQVKRTGKIFRFDPMPAKDRRVIHLTLKTDPEIETFSEGEGAYRKVGVKSKQSKGKK